MMTGDRPLLAPRMNANDETVVVRTWYVADGAWVEAGTAVAELETSKTIVEIAAQAGGFLVHGTAEGGEIGVGDPLGWLMARPGATPPARPAAPTADGRLVSAAAAALMAEHGVAVAEIPGTGAVRTGDVERAIAARSAAGATNDWRAVVDALPNHAEATLIFGGDAQGAVVFDCLESVAPGSAVAYIDDAPKRTTLMGLPVLPAVALDAVRARGIRRAHISIAAPRAKLACAQRLEAAGFEIVGVRHASAVVSPAATIGRGVFLGPLTLVGPHATLGDFVQINNGASVAHDAVVETAARLSDGVRLAGGVVIGEGAFLGLAVTVNNAITIGAGSTVVSGVNVFDHVPPGSIVRVGGKASPLR